jgi:uncharacterized caspase-like protein
VVVLLAVAITLVCSAARAERLALVIGNDNYQHIDKLSNARNDARLMAQLLREAQFDTSLIEDANRTNLWRAVDVLRDQRAVGKP